MKQMQVKIFNSDMGNPQEYEINRFLQGKEIFKVITAHGQGSSICLLVFYYTSESLEAGENLETRIFQGPSKLVEQRINEELKLSLFHDIDLSAGYGDFLKVVLILKK